MRFPWIIWRTTLVDIARLFLVSTAVLVTVVAFAATVKFFAEGKLGPLETLQFMVLAVVPMLQYALPFSALFSATIVYHRMAQDNELLAAHAGGVGHRGLLVPAVAAGLVLAAVMGVLVERAIPSFLWSMENMITQKFGRLVINSVKQRRPIQYRGFSIHADDVRPWTPDRDSGAEDAHVLFGVVLVGFDDGGRPTTEVAARRAIVQVYPARELHAGDDPGAPTTSVIVARLQDASVKQAGHLTTPAETVWVLTMPGGVTDRPKFYSWSGLRRLREEPDRLDSIDQLRRDVAFHLGERLATGTIRDTLATDRRVTLIGESGTLVVQARGAEWVPSSARPGANRWELIPKDAGGIVVERYPRPEDGGRSRAPIIMVAASGGFVTNLGEDRTARRLVVNLELESVVTRTAAGETEAQLLDQRFSGLTLLENPLPGLMDLSSAELLALAGPRIEQDGDEFLATPVRDLRAKLRRLQREITSKQHERVAAVATCFVMVLTGAVTAMRLRNALPLTVYLWGFFPALACVLTISAGEQMIEPLGNVGLFLLWGGVAALALYTLGAYWVVRKH